MGHVGRTNWSTFGRLNYVWIVNSNGRIFLRHMYSLLGPESKDYFIQLNSLSDLIWLGGIVFAYMWKLGLWCCVRCMSSGLKDLVV